VKEYGPGCKQGDESRAVRFDEPAKSPLSDEAVQGSKRKAPNPAWAGLDFGQLHRNSSRRKHHDKRQGANTLVFRKIENKG